MSRHLPLLLVFLALGGSCAVQPAVDLFPAELRDVPWREGDLVDQEVLAARRLLDAGDVRAALDAVGELLVRAPDHVDAHRLRQDLLRRRGREAFLRWEARERVRQAPDDVHALYLLGRIVPDGGEKLRLFRACVEKDPGSFWSWLGYAFALRAVDMELSLEVYERLLLRSEGHPLAAVALAATLRDAGQPLAALTTYQTIVEDDRLPGVAHLGLAETLLSMGKVDESWPHLLLALKQRPADPGAQRIVADLLVRGLGDQRHGQLLDILRGGPGRLEGFARGAGAPVLAELLEREGRLHGALAVLQGADGSGPERAAVCRLRRRLLLATGDVRGFLDHLDEDYPRPFLADETNRVRGLWHRLLRGPWRGGADPLAAAPQAAELVDALLRAGLLVEAEQVVDIALLRHGGNQRLRELQIEAYRERSFEGALRRVIYHGYTQADGTQDLDRALAEIRKSSQEILGRDVVGEPERFRVPLVGEMIDPFGDGLAAHLRSYNRHLVLGQLIGAPAQGLLLTRLSVREVPAHPQLPLPGQCLEVVGENREIRSLSGLYGGDLAGMALLNHYVVDMDAVRDWALDLLTMRRTAREDGEPHRDDPVPDDIGLLESGDGEWRLVLASPTDDAGLEAAILEMIRRHEQGHLGDFFHFLPIEENLFRSLGLLLGNGLSVLGMEATLEMRAELTALALSEHTELVLAHIASFLGGDRSRSPHAVGFSRLAKGLQERLRAAGAPPAHLAPAHWHRLDLHRVRQVATRWLEELW